MDKYVPPKWIKHKMLISWGLRDENDLKSTIHRYNIEEYEKCLQKIDEELKISDGKFLYIIKLVYRNSVYKLPNFLIKSREDFLICKDKLKNIEKKQFIEIWYCKNTTKKEMIYGRVAFFLDELFPRIVRRKIEIVWGNSARMIEKYPNLECTFVSLETDGWGENFRLIDVIQADKSEIEIHEMIVVLLDLLCDYQSRIINFGKFINECGCSSLCIEFLYTNDGKFTIIDWDSDNDLKVINKISQEVYGLNKV